MAGFPEFGAEWSGLPDGTFIYWLKMGANRVHVVCGWMRKERDLMGDISEVQATIEKFVKTVKDNRIRERIQDWTLVPGYAEPGCDEVDVVVLGNFNLPDGNKFDSGIKVKNPIDNLVEKLKKLGRVEVEWSDEWTTCSECFRAVRTCADGYGWVAHFVILRGCDLYCIDCLKKDKGLVDDFIQEIKNKCRKGIAKRWGIDLEQYGFKHIPGDCMETGLHEHQDDDAKVVRKFLNGEGYDVIFSVDSAGQFDVSWSAWVSRKNGNPVTAEDLEKLEKDLLARKNRAGFSPSDALKKALKSGPITMITPEEFVSGSWCKPKKEEGESDETANNEERG